MQVRWDSPWKDFTQFEPFLLVKHAHDNYIICTPGDDFRWMVVMYRPSNCLNEINILNTYFLGQTEMIPSRVFMLVTMFIIDNETEVSEV